MVRYGGHVAISAVFVYLSGLVWRRMAVGCLDPLRRGGSAEAKSPPPKVVYIYSLFDIFTMCGVVKCVVINP